MTSVKVPLPLLRQMPVVPSASTPAVECIPQSGVVLTGFNVARYVEIKVAVVIVIDERQPKVESMHS